MRLLALVPISAFAGSFFAGAVSVWIQQWAWDSGYYVPETLSVFENIIYWHLRRAREWGMVLGAAVPVVLATWGSHTVLLDRRASGRSKLPTVAPDGGIVTRSVGAKSYAGRNRQ